MNTSGTLLGSGKPLSVVCASAELPEDVVARLREAGQVPEFVDGLCGEDRFEEAVAFLAHALPARQAVGWAWVCAREVMGDDTSAEAKDCLEATRAWIQEPTDAHRRVAFDAADLAGMDTPVGCAGLAAFFSGDSLAPPESDPVPPPEGLVGKTVAGCVNISAAWGDGGDVLARYQDFVKRGLELAARVNLWELTEAGPTGA
jgi:hypothetical protein